MNELLLIISVPLVFGGACLAYKFFGKGGLYAYIAVSTVLANIEVLLLVRAFGITQTLGNVLFAAIYLCTDILSENEGKKSAQKGVVIGLLSSVFMLVASFLWLSFEPQNPDTFAAFKTIFSATPRVIAASLAAYAVSQSLDVFLYHRFWKITEQKSGSRRRFLWLRNNAATLISQIINAVLFNFAAFYGIYDLKTLLVITLSSYLIYIVTSILDTPFVYISRKIKDKSN
ncbi:MAG: queuosine precursor transporter [Clostridiales bacterium]|nr:queuosine precursor transporter [Candidatus Equinaster intestinalis]